MTMRLTTLVFLSSVALGITVACPAGAQVLSGTQSEVTEHTEEQQVLNDDAVRAIIAEDYPRAIALLEQALDLGESNLLYLNLGRAYQKFGKCEQARQSYRKARDAPVLENPPRSFVDEKIQEYDEELGPCPGEGTLSVFESDSPEESAEPTEVNSPAPDHEPEATAAETVDEPAGSTGGAIVLIGTGAALGAGALGMHFVAVSRRNSIGGEDGGLANVSFEEAQARERAANTWDTVALGTAIAGAAAVGAGAFFLFRGGDETERSTTVVVSFPAGFVIRGWW